MVRSSFFSLGLSRTPGPRSPGLGFGGETGPLAASRESLSLSLSLSPGVLPVPWGALRGPFADGGVSFAWGPWLPRRRVSRGPLLPPYGWASLGETIPCGLCQIRVPPTRWTSVCLGQVLGRVRFSDGSGSRDALSVGVCSRLSWADVSGLVVLVVWRAGIRVRSSLDHTELSFPVNKGQVWTIQR